MEYLTRAQAIAIIGEEAVKKVESMPCEPTSRVINPAFEPFGVDHTGMAEFSASYTDEEGRTIEAFYYQKEEDLKDSDDLSMLDWEIEYYEID